MNALVATQAQTDSLLQYLEQSTRSSCDRQLAEANGRARDILNAARKRARQEVSEAVIAERLLIDTLLMRETAELATAQRQQAQHRDLALVEAGRELFEQSLLRRWNSASSRTQWIESAIERSGKLLPCGQCHVQHASMNGDAFPDADRFKSVTESANIKAGLIIRCENVVVAASLSGLTDNRDALSARILALFYVKAENNG